MKTYSVQFGVGDPRTYTGLNPTLLIFVNIASGATLVAPSFSEALTGSGIYKFQYGTTTPIAFLADAATTSPGTNGRYVVGQIDPADRSDEYGTTLVAIGSTLFGQGVTNIALGTTAVAIGTTNIGYGVSNLALGTSNLAIGTTILAGQVAMGNSLVAMGVTLAAIGTSITFGFAGIGSTASSFGDTLVMPDTLFGYLKRIQENLEGNSQYVKTSGLWSIYSRGSSTMLALKTISNSVSLVLKT